MGERDDGDYRRRLFEWKSNGPADIAVVYKIRGAISGMLKEVAGGYSSRRVEAVGSVSRCGAVQAAL